MLATAARRAICVTTRVYPPIMPTHAAATAASSTAVRRGLGNIRWVPTIFTLVCIGYGVSAYRRKQIEKYLARNDMERQEMNRRRRNAMLMDAYGEKSSLADIERAMATYETQQRSE